MNTFRRASCVNRSIRFFLDQDCPVERELVIFNTDTEYPMELSPELAGRGIRIVNNNTNYQTGLPYEELGSIRRDSLAHASGDFYVCWDDDDIFLPWHLRQCVDGFNGESEGESIWAWKPRTSMFWKPDQDRPELAWNAMEASILSRLDKIREAGFRSHQGGGEHLSWLESFNRQRRMKIETDCIPSYCFNWHDQGLMRGHKQSGSIDRADNFNFHKENTKDRVTAPLDGEVDVSGIIQCHLSVLAEKVGERQKNGYVLKPEIFLKYGEQYMS